MDRPAMGRSAKRGSVPGEMRFTGSCAILVLTLALELVFNLASAVFFLFFRRAYKDRVRKVMFHGHGVTPALLLGAVVLCGLVAGCGAPGRTEPIDSHSFTGQLKETAWSFQVLANPDPWWKPNRLGSWQSLQQDTLFFFDLDGPYRHGVVETIRMLGW